MPYKTLKYKYYELKCTHIKVIVLPNRKLVYHLLYLLVCHCNTRITFFCKTPKIYILMKVANQTALALIDIPCMDKKPQSLFSKFHLLCFTEK